jgi:hypothetical protein
MTPKEKAKYLVDKMYIDLRPFSQYGEYGIEQAKQCALIAVFEVLIALSSDKQKNKDYMNWYEQVIIEIEKL